MRKLVLNGDGGVEALAYVALTDHATDNTYFYFGWPSKNGGWLVRRQTRSTALLEGADVSNNSSVTAYADAWAARTTLTYGVL